MKFVHLADLHIGRRFGEYSLIEDQAFSLNSVLKAIDELKPDAVFIAGDVYDKPVPSEEAVTLADDFLTRLLDEVPRVLVISGNHDSQARLSFAGRITRQRGLYFSGAFTGKLESVPIDGMDVWLMPHIRPREVARFLPVSVASAREAVEEILKPIPRRDRSVILAHQFVTGADGVERCESEIEPVGGLNAVDASLFADFSYAALGHLHKPQRVSRDGVRYSGSLLKYSFSEANHKKSFVYGEIDSSGLKTTLVTTPSLRGARVITGKLEELLSLGGNTDDFISAVITDDVLPISPGARLACVYERLVSVAWNPPRGERPAPQAISCDESPKGVLNEFFQKMNTRDMTRAEEAYMAEIWRAVGEELGK